jgi:hypothetical protein
MSLGIRGADVLQLQQFLILAGYYDGPAKGRLNTETAVGVKRWQRAVGVAADGVVRAGDILFLPVLPSRVMVASDLQIGAKVGGGESIIDLLPSTPVFTITLSIEQADLVPLNASVKVRHATGGWEARTTSSTVTVAGEFVMTLDGPGEEPLCGDDCGTIPVGDPVLYAVDLVAVPQTTGPMVPVAALRTRPDGTVTIVDEAGRELEIQVLAVAEGRAIVAGVDVGTLIRLYGSDVAEVTEAISPNSSTPTEPSR